MRWLISEDRLFIDLSTVIQIIETIQVLQIGSYG